MACRIVFACCRLCHDEADGIEQEHRLRPGDAWTVPHIECCTLPPRLPLGRINSGPMQPRRLC